MAETARKPRIVQPKGPPLRAALTGSSGTLAATTAAAPLSATSKPCTGILVEAALANTVTVLLGMSDGQTVELGAGDVASIPVGNVNLVYAKSASGTATVNWWSLYGDTPGMGFAVFRASTVGLAPNAAKETGGNLATAVTDLNALARLIVATASAYTRPANTTAYTAGDAVSNNGTAGSVTAISFTVSNANDAPIALQRLRLLTTDTGPSTAGAQFRAYLFNSDPTANSGVGGGDNAAWSQKQAGFVGSMLGSFRAFSDGGSAILVPDEGTQVICNPVSGAMTLYALLQTLTAFTPSANSTVFVAKLEALQGVA